MSVGAGQDEASNPGTSGASDPIAALRMPRRVVPPLPDLPSIVPSSPSADSTPLNQTGADKAPANNVSPVDSTAPASSPRSLNAAKNSGGASASPAAEGPVVAPVDKSKPLEASSIKSAKEAVQDSHGSHAHSQGTVGSAKSAEPPRPVQKASKAEKKNDAAPPAGADFSFKRAPRKASSKSSPADSTAKVTAKASRNVDAKPSPQPAPPAAPGQQSSTPPLDISQGAATKTSQPPDSEQLAAAQQDSHTNGHTESDSGPVSNDSTQASDAAAASKLRPSDVPAGGDEQQATVPPESEVQQASGKAVGAGESPSSDVEERGGDQPATSAAGTRQPSEPALQQAATDDSTTPGSTEADSASGSQPVAESASETPAQVPQPKSTSDSRASTQRNSLPTMSDLSSQTFTALSNDYPEQDDSESPSVHARIRGVKRNSDPAVLDTPEPVRRSSFKWQVSTTATTPQGSRGTGQVVEECCQPREKLKGFWEERSPLSEKTSNGFNRLLSSSTSNEGKKWSVKLNQPLASSKLIDLSYFKERQTFEAPAPPPTFDINIGDAFYSLKELQGMSGSDGIDPSQKELYLDDDAFQDAFGFDKSFFRSKPKWRQVLLKKKMKLF